jgi:translocation and assembly module TamB
VKKWLKRLLAGLILGLLLLFGTVWILLGTQPGVNWLLQTGKGFLPGELNVQQVEGHLLGKLRLSQVKYENPDMLLSLDELIFSWNPGELWQRVLHINELSTEQVQFEWRKPPSDDAPSEPVVLNDIKLPLEIRLDLASVKNANIVGGADAAPVIIDELNLSADWTGNGLTLSTLELTMPEASLQGKGKLNPVNDYPLELTTDISLTMEGAPSFKTAGTIAGDLQRLEIRQELTGDVIAHVSADLVSVLKELKWDLKLNLTQLPADFLPADVPSSLLLDLTGNGDLAQGKVDVKVQLPVGDSSSSDKPEKPTAAPVLNLTASSKFSDLSFDVLGNWENLQWPLTGPAKYASERGGLKLNGSADDYQFTLDGDVNGVDIPPGKLLADGKGNMEQIVLKSFHGDILEGKLDLTGKVSWKPAVSWEAQIDATDINPGVMAPEWPGKLNLSASSSGQLKDDKLSLDAELKQLAGTLREKALSGSGKFNMVPGKVSLQQLVLNSGQAKLLADGELAEQWDLNWQLDVPDMADLLPDASGLIRGQGRLQGDAKQPVVEGKLNLEQVAYQDISLQTASGDFTLGLNPDHQSKVLVDAANLHIGEQIIETLSLKLDGALGNHTITFSVLHELAELQLVGSGGYGANDSAAWKGELQNLTLNVEETADWQLKTPSQLDLSAAKVVVEPVCLHERRGTELCAEADWSAEAPGKARVNLKQFSLEHLGPFLPPQIAKLDGMVNGDVNVEFGAVLGAGLTVKIEPGTFAYLDPQGQEISMQHHGGEIQGTLDKKELKANWKLELDQHLLAGDLRIPRAELDADPMSASLAGKIQVNLKDLNLVSAFVPVIQKIDGSADVDLQLKGKINDPRISGHAQVQASNINIPLAGLELRDANIGIDGNGSNKLDIKGEVSSGEGRLDLSGDLVLDAEQGWPLKLVLKGEQFQAANLPEAQAIISPDIQLSTVKDVLKLRGKLVVPKAVVELKELPEGSESASSDVVIIKNGEVVGGDSGYKVDADVSLELGDEIRFSGFGAKVSLGGGLTVKNIPGKLPTAHGELQILEGSYRAYGQDLTIQKGRVSYAGGNLDNPAIMLRASRRIDDVTVGIDVSGTAKKLALTGFSSDPEMTSDDAIAMLVTGQRTSDPGAARVYAGKELSEGLSVGVNLGGGDEGSEFVVRYKLMDHINLEGTSSSTKSGGRIMYGFEIE